MTYRWEHAGLRRYGRTAVIIGVAMLVPIVPFVIIGELPGDRWLSAVGDDAVAFGAASAALLAGDVLLPVPSSVVITLLGARLDLVPGWLLAWAGLSVGNAIGYAVGRVWPARLAPGIAEAPTFVALVLSRPVPVVAEAFAIAAGALRADVRIALLGCVLGNAGYTLALASIGAAILPESATAVSIAAAVVVPVVGWMIWRSWTRARSG